MESSHPNAKPLSEQETAHLAKLQAIFEKTLENGAFSTNQIRQSKSLIWQDGEVTADEPRTIRETMKKIMDDAQSDLGKTNFISTVLPRQSSHCLLLKKDLMTTVLSFA